jgi:hypothetical protein
LAGLAAFVACGTLLDVTISGGAATWLASFAIGAGVANLTSFELRRRRVTTRPARASDVSIRSTRKRFAVGAAMLGLLATVAFLARIVRESGERLFGWGVCLGGWRWTGPRGAGRGGTGCR